MNPKPGWVRHMANVYSMIERVNFLNDVKEIKRKAAAEVLRKEVCAFVAHEGQSYTTNKCPRIWRLYVLLDDGNVIRKKEDDNDDEGEVIEIKDLSIEEMEFIRGFIVDMLNYELQCAEDEIYRYTNLCL